MEKKVYFEVVAKFDRIESLAAEIERLGWQMYCAASNCDYKDLGAEIASLGAHINWFMNNSERFSPFCELSEKLNLL